MTNIAILGAGVVGGGCATLILDSAKHLADMAGDEINIKYVLDLRELSDRPYADKVVHDIDTIINDESVSVVLECMGGARPAFDFCLAALEAKKSVITSNKEVVSKFGDILLETARRNGVRYLFEASVGGGIPLLRTIQDGVLSSNTVEAISGIVNGTTNYILTRMFKAGIDFEAALAEAMDKGYAEKNPSADIDGIDAARKTSILLALASGKLVGEEDIHTEGITKITSEDVANAKKMGYEIKLLSRVVNEGDNCYAYVAPHFVPEQNMLASISGVFNGVMVRGNYVGDVMMYGQGAGSLATASAVISDLVNLIAHPSEERLSFVKVNDFPTDISSYVCRRYVRFAEGVKLERVVEKFEGAKIISATSVITGEMSEADFDTAIGSFDVENVIRIL